MQRMQDKVCIVTGSSSGLGRAISLAYAKEGGRVVCADLKPEARADVESELRANTHDLIRENGGSAIFVQTDVTEPIQVETLVQRAVEEYGRLDVMVNNAGISIESNRGPAMIHETSESDWDTTMSVNAKSVFLGCKYAAAQMLKQDLLPTGDRGWIINMSSIYGLVGGSRIPCYAASKGAVSNLTRQVALDYADSRIHCNAICPGFTDTAIFKNTTKNVDPEAIAALHPLRGVGKPEDIAGGAIFLASEEARWITGTCLSIDGGFVAK